MITGIDASSVQGALPIADIVSAGHRFLIHKCKQGNDGVDPRFEKNIAAAKAAGMIVGAYHFLYPLPKLDPFAQAAGFFAASKLGSQAGELPPALDLEWPDPDGGFAKWGCTHSQVSEWTKRCAERVAVLFGRKPIIYTYPYFMSKMRAADVAWLAEYPLWIASYGGSAKPAVPAPWTNWTLWQDDGNGGKRLPNGIDADFNVFNGDEAALQAFIGDAAPVSHTRPAFDLGSTRGVQAALSRLGHDPGPIDGIPGKKTQQAIIAFQTASGLKADGILGPKTKAALELALLAAA